MGILKHRAKVNFVNGLMDRNVDVSSVLKAVVSLTSAEILALNSTPKELVPAPGANKINIVHSVTAKMMAGNAAYTGAQPLEIRYTNGAGALATGANFANTFINTTANTTALGHVAGGAAAVLTPVANAAIVAAVPSANPANGTGTMQITVGYRVVDV